MKDRLNGIGLLKMYGRSLQQNLEVSLLSMVQFSGMNTVAVFNYTKNVAIRVGKI